MRVLVLGALACPALTVAAAGQTFTDLPLAWDDVGRPAEITAGPDGGLWFTLPDGNAIGRVSRLGIYRRFPLPSPNSTPRSIAAGEDGNLWFTEETGNRIGRLTPGGMLTEFPLPTAAAAPKGIAPAQGGYLWFTESADGVGKLGRISSDGTIVEFPLPQNWVQPWSIVEGPVGVIWFTERKAGRIGRIGPDGNDLLEYSLPDSGAAPQGIAYAWDGNLWFAENEANLFGRITPAGVLTEFPIPGPGFLVSHPHAMARDAYGGLWMTLTDTERIARVSEDGSLTAYYTPDALSAPLGIGSGYDGALWFAEAGGIGRVAPILEFDPLGTGLYGVAAGPGGAVWYTASDTNSVVRMVTGVSEAPFPLPTPNSMPRGIAVDGAGRAWVAEYAANRIAVADVIGGVVEFPIPTLDSGPSGIALGPDGNMWFTEALANQVGRITPAGTITEFPIPTAASGPQGITAGADGNLWFAESGAGQIGRMTPSGDAVEFDTPASPSVPWGIAAGPDGNVWFTDIVANEIVKMTPDGETDSHNIPTDSAGALGIAAGSDGSLWFTEFSGDRIGRITTPTGTIDEIPMPSTLAGAQGIAVATDGRIYFAESSRDKLGSVDLPRSACTPTSGPAAGGMTVKISAYNLEDPLGAKFSGVPLTDVHRNPLDGGALAVGVVPGLAPPGTLNDLELTWHNGRVLQSRFWMTDFLDVPQSDGFHEFVETIFRKGITAGCGAGSYCRNAAITRAQMAVFVVKAKNAYVPEFVPPPCQGVFPDVPCSSPYAPWIEELANEGVTGGCGGGLYCPDQPVTRAQMAVFLLKAIYGPFHSPADCVGVFDDVPCPDGFAVDWIEELLRRGITGGCGAHLYCPASPVTRGQMAVFLTRTFRF